MEPSLTLAYLLIVDGLLVLASPRYFEEIGYDR